MKRLLLGISLVIGISSSLAFELWEGFDWWPTKQTTFWVDVPGNSASGTPWNTAFSEAMDRWEDVSNFTFNTIPSVKDPCDGYESSATGAGYPDGEGDNHNGVGFSESVCGNLWTSGVLAVTLVYFDGYNLQSDIVFNSSDDLSWDVYDGPSDYETVDFRRVALHELGHAVGLGHEESVDAIMNPNISDIYLPTEDDVNGMAALYGDFVAVPDVCPSPELIELTSSFNSSLGDGNCSVSQIAGGTSGDIRLVEQYQITVPTGLKISVRMVSSVFDAYLTLTNVAGEIQYQDDDTGGATNALIHEKELEAGVYYVNAMTRFENESGGFILTSSVIVDNDQTGLPNGTLTGGPTTAIFHLGASNNSGKTYDTIFGPEDSIDVLGTIVPEEQHIGQIVDFFALILMGDTYFVKNSVGGLDLWDGSLEGLVSFKTETVSSVETLSVMDNLVGIETGLSDTSFQVSIGYRVNGEDEIYFNLLPLIFTITR